MGMGNTPIVILKEGTKRDKGKDAQFNNIAAARVISDAVRSSLGPRGMDKMLVDSMGRHPVQTRTLDSRSYLRMTESMFSPPSGCVAPVWFCSRLFIGVHRAPDREIVFCARMIWNRLHGGPEFDGNFAVFGMAAD